MRKFLIGLGLFPEGKLTRKSVIEHVRKKGWRWLVVVLAFYAIRDTILYIVLPYLAIKGILLGW